MNKNKAVLACIDGSRLSEAVCDFASWLALHADSPLKLLHTIDRHNETAKTSDLSGSLGVDGRDHLLENIADSEHEQGKKLIQAGKKILHDAKQRVSAFGVTSPITCLQHGNLIDSLIEYKSDIRTMVIGARGTQHEDQTNQIGSKLESMIRSMRQPILVAYKEFKEPSTLMIAYDGSETANKALELVASNPLYRDFTCHLVHVSKNGSSNILESAVNTLKAAGVKEVVSSAVIGKPVQALCEYQQSNNIDLTIMGAFSHTRIHDLLLGSFTVKMLQNTNTPLLLQR